MEETLYDYLVRQKFEREIKIDEYNSAKEEYEKAKERLDSFGDMSAVEVEIEKLEGYIEQVKPKPVFTGQMSYIDAQTPEAQVTTISCSDVET